MKKTSEIVGLPIISLVDGGEIGTVGSLVINAADGAIAAIVVNDGKSYRGAKLVHFKDILGIGESALTIEQKAVIRQIDQVPNLEKLLEANINILNTKILTKKGQIKGTVVEVYFDTDTGKIVELHAKNDAGTDFTISADRIYTLGEAITVVVGDNESSDKVAVVSTTKETPVAATPAPVVQPVETAPPAVEDKTEDNGEANNAMQKFEERQKKFLVGKTATRNINADNGTVIINQGEEVTEETIQKAKLAGKFVELSMSLQ